MFVGDGAQLLFAVAQPLARIEQALVRGADAVGDDGAVDQEEPRDLVEVAHHQREFVDAGGQHQGDFAQRQQRCRAGQVALPGSGLRATCEQHDRAAAGGHQHGLREVACQVVVGGAGRQRPLRRRRPVGGQGQYRHHVGRDQRWQRTRPARPTIGLPRQHGDREQGERDRQATGEVQRRRAARGVGAQQVGQAREGECVHQVEHQRAGAGSAQHVDAARCLQLARVPGDGEDVAADRERGQLEQQVPLRRAEAGPTRRQGGRPEADQQERQAGQRDDEADRSRGARPGVELGRDRREPRVVGWAARGAHRKGRRVGGARNVEVVIACGIRVQWQQGCCDGRSMTTGPH